MRRSAAIGILKDDANTLQSKKERRREEKERERVGSAALFGFTSSEKNTLSREER